MKVKELVFKAHLSDKHMYWIAETPIGRYFIEDDDLECYCDYAEIGVFSTLNKAMEGVNRFHRSRILECVSVIDKDEVTAHFVNINNRLKDLQQ